MRKTTLTSLLILCGSTAALANVATLPQSRQTTNDSGNAMRNEQSAGVPLDNDTTMSPRDNDTMSPANDNTMELNTPTPM